MYNSVRLLEFNFGYSMIQGRRVFEEKFEGR